MKRVLVLVFLLPLGVVGLAWTLSCQSNAPLNAPTFPQAVVGIVVPTATPCGYPGATCTPTATPPPLCQATPIVFNSPVTGSTTFGTSNYWGSCGGSGNDVTFKFTLNFTRSVTISTCSVNTNFDTVLNVLSNCNPVTEIACNDDGGCGNAQSLIIGTLPAGTYYIVVDGFGGSAGQYQLSLQ
jgi:hypothetical protein